MIYHPTQPMPPCLNGKPFHTWHFFCNKTWWKLKKNPDGTKRSVGYERGIYFCKTCSIQRTGKPR